MAVIGVNEHKDMAYKVGDTVVLRKFDSNYKKFKEDYSHEIAKVVNIKIYGFLGEISYILDVDKGIYRWDDEDIDHEATERLKFKTIVLTSSGRGQSYYYHLFNEFYADLKNCTFKPVEPKRVIPNKGDQYLYIDLADENLYGIGYWIGDSTDYHMVKLGLIKDTAQECVKVAKEMLKKLELEV